MFCLSFVATYLIVSISKSKVFGNLRERNHLEDPGADGRIILRWISRKRALLNAVISLRIPQNAGNFLTTLEIVSFSRRTLFHAASK